jgi:hypothetical protein
MMRLPQGGFMTIRSLLLSALLVLAAPLSAHAADAPLPYTEGSVWSMNFIRVKAGMGEDYLRSLVNTWKKSLDEAKKQKLVLSYRVFDSPPANREDWDVLLMVEFKNMAALDGLREKMRAIAATTIGDEAARRDLSTKRLDIREVLGVKTARELIFK